MPMDMDNLIGRQRAELMRELVEGHRDRARAQKILDDIRDLEAWQASHAESARGRYAGYKKAREALMALFAAEDRPLAEEYIKREIVDRGGWRRGVDATIASSRMAIQKSIKLHLHGDGAKKWPLKMINDLIGPKDWADERFGAKESMPSGEPDTE